MSDPHDDAVHEQIRILNDRIRDLEAVEAMARLEWGQWEERAGKALARAEKAEAALERAIAINDEALAFAEGLKVILKRAAGRESGGETFAARPDKDHTARLSPAAKSSARLCEWCGDDIHPGRRCFSKRRSSENQECGT